jgi:hypothetical protein
MQSGKRAAGKPLFPIPEACLHTPGNAGGDKPGDDCSCLLSATWREMRRSVFEHGAVPQFRFRQFLFACQARNLLKLQRPIEVCLGRFLLYIYSVRKCKD